MENNRDIATVDFCRKFFTDGGGATISSCGVRFKLNEGVSKYYTTKVDRNKKSSMNIFLKANANDLKSYRNNKVCPHVFLCYVDITFLVPVEDIPEKEKFKNKLSKLVSTIKSELPKDDKHIMVFYIKNYEYLHYELTEFIDFSLIDTVMCFDASPSFDINDVYKNNPTLIDFLYENYYYYAVNNVLPDKDAYAYNFISQIKEKGMGYFGDTISEWFDCEYDTNRLKESIEIMSDVLEM